MCGKRKIVGNLRLNIATRFVFVAVFLLHYVHAEGECFYIQSAIETRQVVCRRTLTLLSQSFEYYRMNLDFPMFSSQL